MESNKKKPKNKKKIDLFEEIIDILDKYDEGNPPRKMDDYEEGCID